MSELQPVNYGAKRLRVSTDRIYTMVREGVLPPGVVVHLGRHIRIDPEKLEEWIASGGKPLPGGWRKQATFA